nr:unnamed protein product [Digitaria exilis]
MAIRPNRFLPLAPGRAMGLLFVQSLRGPKVFKCKNCRVVSASSDAIVSKDFRGRHGPAYLFDSV